MFSLLQISRVILFPSGEKKFEMNQKSVLINSRNEKLRNQGKLRAKKEQCLAGFISSL